MTDPEAPEAIFDKLFRRQSARLVAALLRVLGPSRIDVAEDIVQDTLIAALQAWRFGMPRDPTAWLFGVARNRARDRLRRERVRDAFADRSSEIESLAAPDPPQEDEDFLRVMFSCCHPELSVDSQTALILRLLCGFGSREVAHMFLSEPAAMEKRLVRARRVLAEGRTLFEVTSPTETRARLPAVIDALYLMFDAGYHGSVVTEVVRADVCADAIRLVSLLAAARSTTSPEVHALAALMCLHAARLPARVDAAGALVPLERQDRNRWDRDLVERGMVHLSASSSGEVVSAHHLEAGIAAHHALAPSVSETPWAEIASLYDLLYQRKRSPVVALNGAIARAMVHGPRTGIGEILSLEGRDKLAPYPFYWAALVDLALKAGDLTRAAAWNRAGLAVARNDAERGVFLRRAGECGAGETGDRGF